MFKILLADDEPAALQYISRIIEKRCKGFEVSQVAASGEAALEILKKQKFDVLITDIKMSGLTGIELIEQVKNIDQDIQMMIMSGYSDFEFAQKAIINQVYNYILKPVDPLEFEEIMKKLYDVLKEQEFNKKTQLLKNICKGNYVNRESLEQYFGRENYYAFLLRRNNLPNRFMMAKDTDIYSGPNESVIAYGRDENEVFYLIPRNCLKKQQDLDLIIENMKEKYRVDQSFLTVIAARTFFSINDMEKTIKKIYEVLHKSLVSGWEQTIYLEEHKTPKNLNKEEKDSIKTMEYYVNKGEIKKAKQELKKLCIDFEVRKIPQIQVENILRQICNIVWMHRGYSAYDSNSEYLVEDLFYNGVNMEVLYQSLSDFLFPEEDFSYQKIDTPEYFHKIKQFIQNHLAEPLTLAIMMKEFGVSQSHLSYMFRKYENRSFTNYLTYIRMETAKDKLLKDKEILIRDVAQMVGYHDQFYFCRVFKLYTGVRPTDFMNGSQN